MDILIKNGRVLDPKNNVDEVADILIRGGFVWDIAPQLSATKGKVTVIDAAGMWVTPGLIDMHVHLREPGQTHKETIDSGTRAAAAGGFTTVCAMPNTSPVCDSPEVVAQIIRARLEKSTITVLPVGAITRGLEGREIAALEEMSPVIFAISDDGKSVADEAVYLEAMKRATALGLPILAHCEDLSLTGAGVMHAGEAAEKLGFRGIPSESEDNVIARDIELARQAGAKLHICHVSTAGGVELIRAAQKAGQAVTAEVTPHHIALIDEDVMNPNFKMAPPLRGRADRDALIAALKDGTIGVIATDHAPHHEDEKQDFVCAANGIIGLETAVPIAITHLVETGVLTPLELIAKFTSNPAEILRLEACLSLETLADITIIDPKARHTIDKDTFKSLSRNTPFHGCEVTGRVVYTISRGRIIYKNK
ncbi:MAG: dihydroorotase [Defluviitaleaceae bacterium]|nr:dihydroorotase [Defluviitaleaceae bacterium]